MCCKIINAAIVFFFFACLGLAAIDFAFLFKRWQVMADSIGSTAGTACTLDPVPPVPPTFSYFSIKDWFAKVPIGTQIDALKCKATSGTSTTAVDVVCQFSQPGDAYLFAKKHLPTITEAYTTVSGTTYLIPCYSTGTFLNSKFVYVGYALCAVGFAIAIIVPIIILLTCRLR